MPRRARFTIEGGIYHILSRGNNQQVIFHKDRDYQEFLDILSFYKKKYGFEIYHYVLMGNHIHLIVKIPDGKALSEAMKGIKWRYVQYYRKNYGGIGHFWQERFKSFLIQEGRYLLECGRYIELNPVKARIVEEPKSYYWSSYRVYGEGEKDYLIDFSPEYLGLADSNSDKQRLYREFIKDGLKERRREERYFREGAFGSREFVEEMRKKGLVSLWSHKGKPKKSKDR